MPFDFLRADLNLGPFAGRFARSIVAAGGPAEANCAFINLVAARIELRQPGGALNHNRQHAGGDRVESSQVPDLFRFSNAAHLIHHIVRGPAPRLIDHNSSVQRFPCVRLRAVQI